MKLNYFLIDRFQRVFKNEIIMEKLNICKNVDKYNIMRVRLA